MPNPRSLPCFGNSAPYLCHRKKHQHMDNIDKIFDPRTAQELIQMGVTIVQQGIEIGLSLGETINGWIDDMFDIFKA